MNSIQFIGAMYNVLFCILKIIYHPSSNVKLNCPITPILYISLSLANSKSAFFNNNSHQQYVILHYHLKNYRQHSVFALFLNEKKPQSMADPPPTGVFLLFFTLSALSSKYYLLCLKISNIVLVVEISI